MKRENKRISWKPSSHWFCPSDVKHGRQTIFLPRANAVVKPQDMREALWRLQYFSVRLGVEARSSDSVRYQLVGYLEELFVDLFVVLRVFVSEKAPFNRRQSQQGKYEIRLAGFLRLK